MAIGAIDPSWSKKGSGFARALRNRILNWLQKCEQHKRQHRKLGCYHFYDTICDLHVILASFSSSLTAHSLLWEQDKKGAERVAAEQFEDKIMFPLENLNIVNYSFVLALQDHTGL